MKYQNKIMKNGPPVKANSPQKYFSPVKEFVPMTPVNND
jgi:hypothetical protein